MGAWTTAPPGTKSPPKHKDCNALSLPLPFLLLILEDVIETVIKEDELGLPIRAPSHQHCKGERKAAGQRVNTLTEYILRADTHPEETHSPQMTCSV